MAKISVEFTNSELTIMVNCLRAFRDTQEKVAKALGPAIRPQAEHGIGLVYGLEDKLIRVREELAEVEVQNNYLEQIRKARGTQSKTR